MSEIMYKIIWDFCDWLGYQGISYEALYYGTSKDVDDLIKRYLNDDIWFVSDDHLRHKGETND